VEDSLPKEESSADHSSALLNEDKEDAADAMHAVGWCVGINATN